MTKQIPYGLSFDYVEPNELNNSGGIVIYYNTPAKQCNTAFALALEHDKVEELLHLLNNWIAPSIVQLLGLNE